MEISEENKSILLALCLGDGCINKPRGNGNASLEIGHSIKQEEYCTWKRDLVYKILGGKKPPKIGYKTIHLKGYENEYHACRFSKTHPYFTYLRNILYPAGVKTITRELLNKLTPQGIAIWYMDDGSFYKKDNATGTKSICFDLRISTDSFSKEEVEIICDYFKEVFGIRFYPYQYHKERKHNWIIRANKEAAIKFIDLIRPYVIPSMRYKIEYKTNITQEYETSEGSDTSEDDIV